MAQLSQIAEPARFSPWYVLAGALLIPAVYLPTVHTRFDFIDDGNLVYPAPSMPAGKHASWLWDRIVANYEHLGPFRPVLWLHWDLFAQLCDGDAVRWRLVRLGWCILATAALLTLMRELRLRAWPSLFAAALAMWNPYRNEIWTSLTLSEGVAMPYALAGLWCAARANRSPRAWMWDWASALAVLAALGCKNTFAAIVPAQLFLRMYADGASWREGFEHHRRRAALLALTLLLPVGHYIVFRLCWHPGQYPPTGVTVAQLGRMLSALGGAMSLDFLGVALGLTCVVNLFSRNNTWGNWARNGIWIVAALLTICGVAIYLPMPAVSGRYTMPAVWGLDLAFAAILSSLAVSGWKRCRRLAFVAVIGGLCVTAAANIGRQEKFAARINLLWQTLEYVERQVDREACLAWVSSATLNEEEGIHFRWHLAARGHAALAVELLDAAGRREERCELPAAGHVPRLAITGSPQPPPGGPWSLQQEFHAPYWAGRRHFDSYVWSPTDFVAQAEPDPVSRR